MTILQPDPEQFMATVASLHLNPTSLSVLAPFEIILVGWRFDVPVRAFVSVLGECRWSTTIPCAPRISHLQLIAEVLQAHWTWPKTCSGLLADESTFTFQTNLAPVLSSALYLSTRHVAIQRVQYFRSDCCVLQLHYPLRNGNVCALQKNVDLVSSTQGQIGTGLRSLYLRSKVLFFIINYDTTLSPQYRYDHLLSQHACECSLFVFWG